MTTSRPTRNPRTRRKRGLPAASSQPDRQKPFMQLVEELRAYIDEVNKPLEEWTDEEDAEFLRRSGNDSLAVALALSRPISLGVTSEHPHRPPFDHDR
jgi:hypothetical protein